MSLCEAIVHLFRSAKSILLCFFFFSASLLHAQDELSYFYDKESVVEFENIQNQSFIEFTELINEGFGSGTYWIRVAHQNARFIEFPTSRLNQIKCFDKNGEQVSASPLGVFPTYYSENGPAYFKIDKDNEAYIPVILHKKEQFPSYIKSILLIDGLYYGFALMLLVVNIFYFFSFRESTFITYALFLFFITSCLFIRDNLLIEIFSPAEIIHNFIENITHFSIGLMGAIFASSYLQHSIYLPRLKWITKPLLIILFSLYTLNLITGEFYFFAFGDLTCFFILLTYWFSGFYLFRKNAFSKFFTIAYVLILILAFDYFIAPLFGIPNFGITTDLIKIGGLLEMIVLTYAVVFRMKELQFEFDRITTDLHSYINQVNHLEGELNLLIQRQDKKPSTSNFSEREIEVLMLIAKHKSNKEIAEQLFISINTVKYHVKNLYEKLEVNSRKEAKKMAGEITNQTSE